MEMPFKKTVELKEAKDIEFVIFWGEKIRTFLLLEIPSNGGKLPPLLIFKAKKEKIWKKL